MWAFAKACHVDARFFNALARSSVRCLDEFNAQDLVNTAWGFAKVGQIDAQLFTAVAQRFAAGQCLDDLNAQQISNVAWAFAKADQSDARLFTALARSAEERAADFSAPDLASIAWAFANAGQLDSQLFAALAAAAEQFLDDFNDEELDNTEWAFGRAGQQGIVKRLRLRRKRATGAAAAPAGPAVDVSKCGCIVVAGGGIGGAAVAVALQRKGFEVVVLEADSGFDARKQGYGLTIQGQGATQAMGINLAQDDAPSTSHYTFNAEGHILGFYGEAFGSKSKDRQECKNSGRFIHIPRQMLRSRILDEVRPGTIRWSSKLKSYACWSDDEGGRHSRNGVTVTLMDGTTLDAALLIGSDGIFSTVRRQLNLPGDRLNYVGLVVVLGIVEGITIPLTERRIFETVDGTTRIYAMPFTTSSTAWSKCTSSQQLTRPSIAPAAGPLAQGCPLASGGEPLPLRCRREAAAVAVPAQRRQSHHRLALQAPPCGSCPSHTRRRLPAACARTPPPSSRRSCGGAPSGTSPSQSCSAARRWMGWLATPCTTGRCCSPTCYDREAL